MILDLDTNYLNGIIPQSLGNLAILQYLYLSTNHLTGIVHESISSLPKLQYINLYSNLLTGNIPKVFSANLQQIQLYNNLLSGSLPSLTSLIYLQVLLVQRNFLTGNLNNIFDPLTQLRVETIVLNNNQLTGTVPEAIFRLYPSNFVGTGNCFEGPLPIAAICSNPNMLSFVADGMSSASSCRNKLFVGPVSAYMLLHAIGGSIPACLFQLPNIATLHLSGNSFIGSIPNNILLSDTLSDLSISHNVLTGTVPQQIQLKKWDNIDLSYNRLSGTLITNFAPNGSVELDNNRLSGDIPFSLQTLVNVSLLGSNTFSCLYDQSD